MRKHLYAILLISFGLTLIVANAFVSMGDKGGLDVEIKKASFIMPAAHQVYANEHALNGQHYLFKAKLINTSKKRLEDVIVRYRIPGYIEWTQLIQLDEMIQGQTAVVVCYPKFPNSITEKMTESMEKVEMEIAWNGAGNHMIEEAFSFKIVNRNDFVFTGLPSDEIATWGDAMMNKDLLGCFVTPNDPIVKYYTQIVQEKVLKGESASVTKDPKDAVRFLMGIYEATRLSHMVYSGTQMLPKTVGCYLLFAA